MLVASGESASADSSTWVKTLLLIRVVVERCHIIRVLINDAHLAITGPDRCPAFHVAIKSDIKDMMQELRLAMSLGPVQHAIGQILKHHSYRIIIQ